MYNTIYLYPYLYLGKPSNNEDETHPDWLPSIDVGGQTSKKTSNRYIQRQKRDFLKTCIADKMTPDLIQVTHYFSFIVTFITLYFMQEPDISINIKEESAEVFNDEPLNYTTNDCE